MTSAALAAVAGAAEYHVSVRGRDTNRGARWAPFRTIQHAADLAQPGDTITVHEGIYRERINPPRGGESDRKRIVYRAARGARVEIRGSEVVTNWVKAEGDAWMAVLPNAFFGEFNPYGDRIKGDWFNPKGREHHTGAVYLNGDWLVEAARLEDVLSPTGSTARADAGGCLLNVAWFRPATGGDPARVPAAAYAAQDGVQKAPCSEGGECVGWIEDGDWVRYERVDLGRRAERVEIRAASETAGGWIELRLDAPDGDLLGSCVVPNTGGWQSWVSFEARIKPLGGVRTICLVFRHAHAGAMDHRLWFARVDGSNTTIWAQFKGVNPNEELVEINVRQTVFYPDKPGRNFITVRGFAMRHAATPWAPPTAEQIGLIGTHWSRGWIIEDNVVSHSVCSGIALGKHGDEFDNTSADTAEGYVKTIERAHAHAIPWTRENIGHHLVRHNTISHCEQAGIVGSLGPAFSVVTGNTIHDIHVRRLFTGAEMAGIKFHAAIDVEISRNHIYRTCRGLWMDWMAQGTRITGNLCHDNSGEDLFVEVDHGPFLVDNNLFLSGDSLLDMSQGGAYAHNLWTGRIVSTEEPGRETPYHPAHSTTVAGLKSIRGGDNRYYNNVLVGAGAAAIEAPRKEDRHRRTAGHGLHVYDQRELLLHTGGNVYYRGARPYLAETDAVVRPDGDPRVSLVEENGRFFVHLVVGPELEAAATRLVTTDLLGKAAIPQLAYENADGSPLSVDRDFFGRKRDRTRPAPGPFEDPGRGEVKLRVW